jgi:putative peptide maturation dehydrogenase
MSSFSYTKRDMFLHRCALLCVELDQEPRFDFASLLQGGDGLDRSVRWRALAPHLSEPVTVSLAQLAVLEACPPEGRLARDALLERHAAADVDALVATGLLLPADAIDERAARDANVRDIAWWPPAAVAQAHGAWDGIDIEARNEAGLMPSSEQMVESFGTPPAHAYRRTEGAAQPLRAPLRRDFDGLLAQRKTCRNFDAQATVAAADLATMLHRVWGAIGTLELAPGAIAVKKNSPAGGGLHAVEAYLLVQRADGLAPGFYHYLAVEHALEPMRALTAEEVRSYAHRFVAGQHWFADVPVMVVMTARFDRLFWKYRRHAKAWRVVHLDVGHLSQTMYLSAADLGLGAFVTAAINDREVERALELAPMREGAIAVVGFGPRAATKTTLELDDMVPTAASRAAGRADE